MANPSRPLTFGTARVWTVNDDPRLAVFQPEFLEDLTYWVQTDRKTALRLLRLVELVLRDPFAGMGKPEPLKYLGPNLWSRRLTDEHRLVYLVREHRIDFLQGRYHYG
ncbi:Txe/YoeB family addiction module toxin [Deinococcus sp. RL]|uniref:Txe/YoeB family addiction module toxin n=1 Tax=Deinococcus sp. RL TaxID=1489678 RepID=UPI00190FB7FA|nr:Txe/YoeB family addiction module toxin [Deinococcus sp. RL]